MRPKGICKTSITFRVSHELRGAMEQIAERDNVSLGTAVKRVLLAAVGGEVERTH